MIIINEYIHQLETEYNIKQGQLKQIQDTIEDLNYKKDLYQQQWEKDSKTLKLINDVSLKARQNAVTHLENIVTSALQCIFEKGISFKIEIPESDKAGISGAEFYVEEMVNGVVSKQDPKDACAGGYVDVISTALRYAYIQAFDTPVINNAMFLDEPGKMVSEAASVKFAEFVKKLGQLFNKQTIMITHNDSLKMVADNTIFVSKINDKSMVKYTEDDINV